MASDQQLVVMCMYGLRIGQGQRRTATLPAFVARHAIPYCCARCGPCDGAGRGSTITATEVRGRSMCETMP